LTVAFPIYPTGQILGVFKLIAYATGVVWPEDEYANLIVPSKSLARYPRSWNIKLLMLCGLDHRSFPVELRADGMSMLVTGSMEKV
jgi:hypothetical protein